MKNSGKIILAHEKRTICAKVADYKLIKLLGRKSEYLIFISYGEDKVIHKITGKILDVAMLYDLIVKNAVTPCTLCDVIEDLTYSK